MCYYRCLIKYKPPYGGLRQVVETIEAKNSVDAKARASGMYAGTVSVHVSGTSKAR